MTKALEGRQRSGYVKKWEPSEQRDDSRQAGRQKEDRQQSLPAEGVDIGTGMPGRPVRRLVSAKDALARPWAVRAVRWRSQGG